MLTKNDVISKINELEAYSVAQKPKFETQYKELITPCVTAINSYFDTTPNGMIEALENYVFQTYCDIFTRNMTWEKPVPVSLPSDFPEGYNDIRKCFYKFESILSVTPEQFFNAWVEEAPTGEGTVTPEPVPVSNPYLDALISELETAPDDDVKNIVAVNTWCENVAGSLNLINLLEDQGKIEKSTGAQDVAKIVYIDHGLLDVIQTRNYKVYVPTYLKG